MEDKFIMLYVSNKDSESLLKDALDNQGIERGLIVRDSIPKELLKHFEKVSKHGYFPVGMVEDKNEPLNIEFLFHRHPKQTEKMKLVEYKSKNPYKL